MRDDFIDEDLFGNQAGEDESKDRLSNYYLEKPENSIFFSERRPLAFVRARKGVGKSALLNYASFKVEKADSAAISITIKASELISIKKYPISGSSALEYENYWKECLCTRIAIEIGRNIKFAASDDCMMLVEMSEFLGFKGRNIVSALSERFTQALPQLITDKKCAANAPELIKRYTQKEDVAVWLFIDDIDATFVNTQDNRMLISTFFTACRNIINSVKGLFIRASVRTDVWAIIKDDESLDKCEQYMVDLKWSTEDTGRILSNKILTFFSEHYPQDVEIQQLKNTYPKSQTQVFDLVFNGNLRWGNRYLAPYRPIHILSAGRPRWAAQLCKMAAADAYKKDNTRLTIGHFNFVMFDYGKFRLSDLYKEHSHQCNQLKNIIESFRNGNTSYNTKDLLAIIDKQIMQVALDAIQIEGVEIKSSLEIAHFLYRIGFITLDDNTFETGESFIRFEDIPDLLIPANCHQDDLWAIHPSYRTILHLQKNN